MIAKEKILSLIGEKLSQDMFLVDVHVSPANVIQVEIDSFSGLTIDQCVDISRHIENSLDRESEDFELQVSSPGVGQPFRVKEQYARNLGKNIEVLLTGGTYVKGCLTEADDNNITVAVQVRENQEGSKKKMLVTQNRQIAFSDIDKAKVLISFK